MMSRRTVGLPASYGPAARRLGVGECVDGRWWFTDDEARRVHAAHREHSSRGGKAGPVNRRVVVVPPPTSQKREDGRWSLHEGNVNDATAYTAKTSDLASALRITIDAARQFCAYGIVPALKTPSGYRLDPAVVSEIAATGAGLVAWRSPGNGVACRLVFENGTTAAVRLGSELSPVHVPVPK